MNAHKFTRRDLWWLLAYPAYQIIGTIRHEGSHALAVLLEGGTVREFVFWPTWGEKFYWGYVRWSGSGVTWITSFAPYLVDLVTFAVFYALCTRVAMRRWLWVNLAIVGLVSPLINSGYRYASSFVRDGDLAPVMRALPDATVHAYFIGTLALYAALLVRMQRRPQATAAPRS